MINRLKRLAIGAMMVALAGYALADQGTDGVLTALMPDDLVVVQAGEQVYRVHCAACHGPELEGQPEWRIRDADGFLPAPPHDASGHTWHHADDQLFEITKYGPAVVIDDATYKTRMPAYRGILSDEDIVAVLSYIKNSWPAEEREWQDQVNGTQFNGSDNTSRKPSLLERLLK